MARLGLNYRLRFPWPFTCQFGRIRVLVPDPSEGICAAPRKGIRDLLKQERQTSLLGDVAKVFGPFELHRAPPAGGEFMAPVSRGIPFVFFATSALTTCHHPTEAFEVDVFGNVLK